MRSGSAFSLGDAAWRLAARKSGDNRMLASVGRRLAAASAPSLVGSGGARGIAASRAAADLRDFLDPDTADQYDITYGASGKTIKQSGDYGRVVPLTAVLATVACGLRQNCVLAHPLHAHAHARPAMDGPRAAPQVMGRPPQAVVRAALPSLKRLL